MPTLDGLKPAFLTLYFMVIPTGSEASFSHLVVYTASELVEQSTPNASAISDTVRVVSNIQFDDYDLDVVSYRLAFGTLRNSATSG
eukprot:s874_g4.t1